MSSIISHNIIIDAAEELVPFVSIAALDRKNFCPKLLSETPKIDKYLKQRFGKNYSICKKAREGIVIVLRELNLGPNDVVTILTTTGNSYISGCVTKAIDQVCKWSREFTKDTKVILVNHEFGYSYENLEELRKYNLPIIEDCAHSFFTKSKDIGRIGDYVIYSFPKGFSTQIGGLIVYKGHFSYRAPEDVCRYVKSALEPQIEHIDEFVAKRFENYQYYCTKLKSIGISPYFTLKDGDVPGVYMFKWDKSIDYRNLKQFLNSNGIDSSVFFGQEAYFVPVHHNLGKCEIDYICELIRYYYKNFI